MYINFIFSNANHIVLKRRWKKIIMDVSDSVNLHSQKSYCLRKLQTLWIPVSLMIDFTNHNGKKVDTYLFCLMSLIADSLQFRKSQGA